MRKFKNFLFMVLSVSLIGFASCDNTRDDLLPDPDVPGNGTGDFVGQGTETAPYTVADIVKKNPQSTADALESAVWAKGYIVGYRDSNFNDFFGQQETYTSDLNVYLADDKNETDFRNCISIQVTASFRGIIGLQTNPANWGKELMVRGDLMKYNSIAGVKNMTTYKIDGSGPSTPSTGDVTVSGDAATAAALVSWDFQNVTNNTSVVNTNWQNVIVSGERDWQGKLFEGNGYAQATAHNAPATAAQESWLITQGVNLNTAEAKVFSFKSAIAYWQNSTIFEVYVLQNEGGTTKRTKVTVPTLPTAATANYVFVASGDIDLSAYSGIVYIGFRYVGNGGASQSTTWCVDDVLLGKAGEVSEPVTTVSLRYEKNSVFIGEQLECTLTATVTNAEGETTITAAGVPAWATFTVTGANTATITGTAPSEVGTFSVTVTATNNEVTTASTFNIIVSEPVEAGVNLLINGDLEDWTGAFPTGWTNSTTGKPALNTEFVQSGNNSAKFLGLSAQSNFQQVIPVVAGLKYRISYWTLDNDTHAKARMWSQWVANGTNLTTNEAELRPAAYTEDNAAWVETVHELTAPEGATTFRFEVRSYRESTSMDGGAIYFDNFSIILVD